MFRILWVRLPWLLVTLLGLTAATFFLMNTVPGGPFAVLEAGGMALSPENIAQIRKSYGLDKPLWQQYLIYMGGALRGDFGRSLVDYEAVSVSLRQGLPASAQLGIGAAVLAVLVGVPLGVVAAVHKGSWFDQAATAVSILGVCVPSFVLGFLLIVAFALDLSWLPVAGWGTWRQELLPIITLSVEPIALFTRYVRASMLEILSEVYVTVARSKGVPEGLVLFKHALKNALFPVVTVFGLVIPHLVAGSFLIETLFAIPGAGRLFVNSIFRRDYPVIMGCAIVYAALVTLANLVVDITYLWLDPRVRYE